MKSHNAPTPATCDRRQFLRVSTVAATALTIVPAGTLGLRGEPTPNSKLNLAGIGIGGQGGHDLQQLESENIVALCDVAQNHAAHTFKRYPKARQFTDYR